MHFELKDGLAGEKRGEYVLVIEGAENENPLCKLSVKDHLLHYISGGMAKKDAVKQVAKDRNAAKSEIYKIALEL